MSKIIFDETGASSYKKKAKDQIKPEDVNSPIEKNNPKQRASDAESQRENAVANKDQKAEKPSGIKITAQKKEETRTKAVNFKLRPSLKEQFEKKCKKVGVSQNNAIEQLIEIFVNMEE